MTLAKLTALLLDASTLLDGGANRYVGRHRAPDATRVVASAAVPTSSPTPPTVRAA